MQERRIPGGELLFWVAFSWGACTFFPVGVAYAHMLFALACIGVGWRQRLPALRQGMLLWPMAMVLAWTMLALVFGAWFDDSATRLFHIVRVLLLLLMGMSLSRSEATMAIGGFLVGAVLAAMIVAVHHVWGLPPLTIWNSLLKSRQNFSSGNMIMMAIGASLFFHFGLRNDQKWIDRKVAWGAAAALLATVAAHAISRNAQILLPMLFAVAILYHFRAWRAVLGGLILAGVMVLGALQWSATTQERFGEMVEEAQRVVTAEDYTTSVGERWRMHEEAIRGMMAHPIFGTGLGSWLPRWRVVAQESIESLSPEKTIRSCRDQQSAQRLPACWHGDRHSWNAGAGVDVGCISGCRMAPTINRRWRHGDHGSRIGRHGACQRTFARRCPWHDVALPTGRQRSRTQGTLNA
jgi:O-antigen ligase